MAAARRPEPTSSAVLSRAGVRAVPDSVLAVIFLVTVLFGLTSLATPAPPAFHAVAAVGLLGRAGAAAWLLATRGRRRHRWTLPVLLLLDIAELVLAFSLVPFAHAALIAHCLLRVPFICAALPRRPMLLVLGVMLGGAGALMGLPVRTAGLPALWMPVMFGVAVLVAAYSTIHLSRALAASEARAQEQSLHDALTGLPNRTLYADRLAAAVARTHRFGTDVAVLLIDVDRFKLVNDSRGHRCGDELLVAIARRLRGAMRASDTLARLGGDEFAVIVQDVHEPRDALVVATHLREVLRAPFLIGGTEPGDEAQEVHVTASTGIAFARGRDGDSDLGAVLREADAAMYKAKARGRGHTELFDESMGRDAQRHLDLENQLRHDVESGSGALSVAFQPVVDPASGHVLGVEALARWNCERYGAVPPEEFIAIAEDSDLIHTLGRTVLRTALEHTAWWQSLHPAFEVAVNVSPVQLQRPGFAAEVQRLLAQTRVSPQHLCLEVTEGVLLEANEVSSANLRALHEAGVELAVDDFGSGYSSLAQLRRFQVGKLKADRSFVTDAPILRAVADLGAALGVRVLAEGVETAEQQRALVELGYPQAQGYLWARPQPADAITDLLRSRQQVPSATPVGAPAGS
ncbi:diguanylate cyclase (GGDEF)-like protein [Kineococcus xinjiangensis]|uniref:Diguanylate cyclase (GGDEF)-like protein n=1 Tax=Kineococcus xinjiangensis TaxID=512762 RepID=A0A2S6IGV9_9ACTN|nr:EAL domain-containing protein [Kineococcus xinjiangensis]PPK93390.1 diguanylate cyclase (GGDEF)-like protein [Kineococcus xinjiangensis]